MELGKIIAVRKFSCEGLEKEIVVRLGKPQ